MRRRWSQAAEGIPGWIVRDAIGRFRRARWVGPLGSERSGASSMPWRRTYGSDREGLHHQPWAGMRTCYPKGRVLVVVITKGVKPFTRLPSTRVVAPPFCGREYVHRDYRQRRSRNEGSDSTPAAEDGGARCRERLGLQWNLFLQDPCCALQDECNRASAAWPPLPGADGSTLVITVTRRRVSTPVAGKP